MKVSLKSIPLLPVGAMYWERALDPFHPLASNEGRASHIPTLNPSVSSRKVRANGWMAIDDSDNPVLFVPDTTVLDDAYIGEFELRPCVSHKTRAYQKHGTQRKCYKHILKALL
jgi:hypothetical protein